MNYLILFFKGFIIGIGKIIPGVSGSHIAMSLHVYEESLDKLQNIKTNIIYFLFLGLGFIISIILMSPLIIYLINNYYIYTMCFFIGLLSKTVKLNDKSKIVIPFSFIVLLIYLFIRIPPISINNPYISFTMGIIESITTIIPGISGTATYMVLGCYKEILQLYSFNNIYLLSTFILGFISSSIILIKGITYLFHHYHQKTESIIIIFMLSSLLFLITKIIPHLTIFNIVPCLSIFIMGYTISSIIE